LREYGHLFSGTQDRLTEQIDDLRQDTVGVVGSAEIVGIDERRSPGGHEKGTGGHKKGTK